MEWWFTARLTLIDVMLMSMLLLGKIFAIALYRRHNQSDREARTAAENLWHVRQVTAALVARDDGGQGALEDAVRNAPIDVILHLLRVQSGPLHRALLNVADEQDKFAALQKSLFATNTIKIARALQQIEICKTASCIQSVDVLMRHSKNTEIRLQAAWTRQRMGAALNQQEILDLTIHCKSSRPLLHAAIAATFARDFSGSPDLLFSAFAESGVSDAGIDMLARLKSDDALWRLLVLSGNADQDISKSARTRLSAERAVGRPEASHNAAYTSPQRAA